MYSRILLATDLSEISKRLVEHLPNLISVGLKEVVLVHVVSIRMAGDFSKRLQEHDRALIDEQKLKLEHEGIHVTVEVPIGIPSYEINKIADKEDVSLIMIGSHGRCLMKEVILGSTGQEIIWDSRKPVLIMKCDGKKDERGRLFCENIFESILYPTDFSRDAGKVLPYIKKALDAGCEKIILLHVQEEHKIIPHLEDRLEEFNRIDQERLDGMRKDLVGAGVKNVKTIIRLGKIIPAILEISQAENCSLIALGARGRSLVGEIFIGSTANNVVRHAMMPVLFVNRPQDTEIFP